MPLRPRMLMPPKMPSRALRVFLAMASPSFTPTVMSTPSCSSPNCFNSFRACSVIIFLGTGLMAGPPTSRPSPGLVTLPTPSPCRKRTRPGWLLKRTVARSSAPWVASGSSPPSLTVAQVTEPSSSWRVQAMWKTGFWPSGRMMRAVSWSLDSKRQCKAATTQAVALAPVVNPVRVPLGLAWASSLTPRSENGESCPPVSAQRLGDQAVDAHQDRGRHQLPGAHARALGHAGLAGDHIRLLLVGGLAAAGLHFLGDGRHAFGHGFLHPQADAEGPQGHQAAQFQTDAVRGPEPGRLVHGLYGHHGEARQHRTEGSQGHPDREFALHHVFHHRPAPGPGRVDGRDQEKAPQDGPATPKDARKNMDSQQ